MIFAILAFTVSSCNDHEIDDLNEQKALEVNKNVLDFDSQDEIIKKIELIQTLKDQKEKFVIDEMFNADNASSIDISEQTELTVELVNSVKEYHQRRLDNIYDIREELGFTSIQSVADEINSLRLIDPSRATDLMNENNQQLHQGQFFIEPIVQSRLSEVLNLEGKLLFKGNLQDYSQNNLATGSDRVSPIPVAVRQDILTGNIFYAITWHAGFEYIDLGGPYQHQYTPFTKLASLVNIGSGFFLYPSKFDLHGQSNASFLRPSGPYQISINVNFVDSPYVYKNECVNYGDPVALGSRNDSAFYVTQVQMSSGFFNTVSNIPGYTSMSLTSSSFINNY